MPKQALNRRFGLWIVVGAMCTGCLPVPVPMTWYGEPSRTNVDEATAKVIIPGQTTKEDVIHMLGEPDVASNDGRSFVYRSVKVKFLLVPIPVGYYWPGVGKVRKRYRLLITFDERGMVTQREVQSYLALDPRLPP